MKLILIRHGQSTWNRDNRFTGWVDVPLTDQGVAEASEAGQILKNEGLLPDVVFTSLLRRAIETSYLSLDVLDRLWIPTHRSWRLNERHYGALAGLDKNETIEKYGADKVLQWRRSYSLRPPEQNDTSQLALDPRYANLYPDELPVGESLQDVERRLLPYWKTKIVPELQDYKTVMLAAHGNSLRALVKGLEKLGDEEVAQLEIPTGEPRVYEFDSKMNVIESRILKLYS